MKKVYNAAWMLWVFGCPATILVLSLFFPYYNYNTSDALGAWFIGLIAFFFMQRVVGAA